jgi:hypothetical protein
MSENVEQTAAPVQVQLTTSGVVKDLDSGLTRDDIKAKYNLTTADMKSLFSHEKLKGRKTKPAPGFILTDDMPDEPDTNPQLGNEVAPSEPSAETSGDSVVPGPTETEAIPESGDTPEIADATPELPEAGFEESKDFFPTNS